MRWESSSKADSALLDHPEPSRLVTNTRTSLWADRWPAIALPECIEKVEAAPPALQTQVKWDLPCQSCVKNTACLNAKRKELGPLMYDREILTSPRTSESSLFPREMMEPMLLRRESLVRHWLPPFSMEHEYAVLQSWDLAWSEKIGGDWMVGMTAYVHKVSGRRHLLDIVRVQRLTFDEQIDLIESEWKRFNADMVVIETNAAQKVWKQRVAKHTAVPVVSHDTGSEKQSLDVGVPALLILFENRKWEIPYAPGYHREEVDVFLAELEAFGWVDGKLQGVGEHDDTVMSFWHLNWAIDKFLAMGASEHRRDMQEGEYI